MLWAMTPHRPLQPVDLTTASLSPCPTCKPTRAAKQVNIMKVKPLLPVPLEPWTLSVLFLPLYNPRVPTVLLSVVSQPADEGNSLPAVKRRRVTAEMEGKYIINMPKGTTPRTRRILAQQAKKGTVGLTRWPRQQLPQAMLFVTTTNQN